MARLLVVEDEPDVAEMVTFTLEKNGHAVRIAYDAYTALREFAASGPELVILDIALPDRSGVDVCAAIREQSRVPILFLTARASLQDKIRAFRMGGDDYLVKPFLPTELVLRVDALLRRVTWRDEQPARVTIGDLEIDAAGRQVRLEGRHVRLTPVEMEILSALASTPGVPWSSERLARRLALPVESPAEAAELIYMKVSRLRRKIEPEPHRPRYLRTQRSTGYFLDSSDAVL